MASNCSQMPPLQQIVVSRFVNDIRGVCSLLLREDQSSEHFKHIHRFTVGKVNHDFPSNIPFSALDQFLVLRVNVALTHGTY